MSLPTTADHAPEPHSPEWLAIVDSVADDALSLARSRDLRAAVAVLLELLTLSAAGTESTDHVIVRWADAALRHLGADPYTDPCSVLLELHTIGGDRIPLLTPAERWAIDVLQAHAGDDAVALAQLLEPDPDRPEVYGERLLSMLILAGATLRHPAGAR